MARRILIVDDDPNALRLIGYSLQQEGYDVLTAKNGTEGLTQAKQQHPDLIVLDIMMPDMDGFEVCRRLRADSVASRVPVIMLTAKGQVADRIAGLRAGADDYVVKPADPGELVARVEAVLKRAAYWEKEEARVLSFLGAKGGVGTTMVAVNVATQIAKSGRDAVLVDLRETFGTAALHLGLKPHASIGTLFHKGESRSKREITDAATAHPSGLRVLASPQQPQECVALTPTIVSSVIDAFEDSAGFVLLDLPAYPAAWRREAIERSDFAVVMTDQDPSSLASARVLLSMLRGYGSVSSRIGAVLVHRVRTTTEMSALQIAESLEVGLLGVIPSAPEEAAAAARLGAPLVLAQPTAPISLALAHLADRLSAEQIALQRF